MSRIIPLQRPRDQNQRRNLLLEGTLSAADGDLETWMSSCSFASSVGSGVRDREWTLGIVNYVILNETDSLAEQHLHKRDEWVRSACEEARSEGWVGTILRGKELWLGRLQKATGKAASEHPC